MIERICNLIYPNWSTACIGDDVLLWSNVMSLIEGVQTMHILMRDEDPDFNEVHDDLHFLWLIALNRQIAADQFNFTRRQARFNAEEVRRHA